METWGNCHNHIKLWNLKIKKLLTAFDANILHCSPMADFEPITCKIERGFVSPQDLQCILIKVFDIEVLRNVVPFLQQNITF